MLQLKLRDGHFMLINFMYFRILIFQSF